jgi:putative ubiquitin-RnfH superfamily antitoxin RatB of RatAB toxin-antitoxin module
MRVGIWNRNAKLDTVVRDGDRVEMYRPLVVDPKEARRIRAQVRQRRR